MERMIWTFATMTCSHCGESYEVEMPMDRCVVIFTCPRCGENTTPKRGDWCVFCAYTDKKCPIKQEDDEINRKK